MSHEEILHIAKQMY